MFYRGDRKKERTNYRALRFQLPQDHVLRQPPPTLQSSLLIPNRQNIAILYEDCKLYQQINAFVLLCEIRVRENNISCAGAFNFHELILLLNDDYIIIFTNVFQHGFRDLFEAESKFQDAFESLQPASNRMRR